jgi:hypothetical protein
MHLEAEIDLNSEMHLDALVELNSEMHLEAVKEPVWGCTWRPKSSGT